MLLALGPHFDNYWSIQFVFTPVVFGARKAYEDGLGEQEEGQISEDQNSEI